MERTDPASSEDVKRMVQDLGSTIQRTLAELKSVRATLQERQKAVTTVRAAAEKANA